MNPWWQPPKDAVPAVLPIVEPLVRARAVAITLVGAHVYREGLELLIDRRMRRLQETDDQWQSKIRDFLATPDALGRPGADALRYSVIADDEETLANSLFRGRANVNIEPSGLSVMRTRQGASGDQLRCESSEGLWLWPLPTADHVDVVVRWPAAGISYASATISTAGLTEMSLASQALWSDEDGG